MGDVEFNLLNEPWIRVMREDCRIEEVSLSNALLRAHEYRGLAGELPTQDTALLRLLLAVLHAVFERVDANGEKASIETADEALDRWAELWENGRFPEEPLKTYFGTQRDNFWLFHPTRPFWQIPKAVSGTEYEASKLNGNLSESSNKIRLFPERTGVEKRHLTYAEAARWLLYVNAYDDTSAKPTKDGKASADGKLPSPGAGWLGKIGYVCITGDTLFETLMLNFVLLDNKGEIWTDCLPAWELEEPRSGERTEISVPNDQAALLSLQSRRLILHREDSLVTGYHLLGGDFFQKENAFCEQMTIWAPIKDKKGIVTGYQPRRHDKSHQLWRDFASYIPSGSDIPEPGVIRWNSLLQKSGILHNNKVMHLTIASVQYGDKDFFVADLYADSLSLHLNLLSDLGKVWCGRINDMVTRCDRIARNVGLLAHDLFLASGGDPEKEKKDRNPSKVAREQFYYEIDVPFRKWLTLLDAEDTAEIREQKIADWCRDVDRLAQKLAEKMVRDAGRAAFIGKTVSEDKSGKRYYSSSLAMQWFRINMKNIDR